VKARFFIKVSLSSGALVFKGFWKEKFWILLEFGRKLVLDLMGRLLLLSMYLSIINLSGTSIWLARQ
jgi:hypothetical protein